MGGAGVPSEHFAAALAAVRPGADGQRPVDDPCADQRQAPRQDRSRC